jgi:hypothetical protein
MLVLLILLLMVPVAILSIKQITLIVLIVLIATLSKITSALSYSLKLSLLRMNNYRETESNCHQAVINRPLYL